MDLPPLPLSTITLDDLENKYTPLTDDHDEKYGVPTLEELGESYDLYIAQYYILNETSWAEYLLAMSFLYYFFNYVYESYLAFFS